MRWHHCRRTVQTQEADRKQTASGANRASRRDQKGDGTVWRTPTYKTLIVAEHLPMTLRNRTLYVVEDDGYQEQVAMLCPCGCGRTLHMNLLPDDRPCWQLTQHGDGTSFLHPSVWQQKTVTRTSGPGTAASSGQRKQGRADCATISGLEKTV